MKHIVKSMVSVRKTDTQNLLHSYNNSNANNNWDQISAYYVPRLCFKCRLVTKSCLTLQPHGLQYTSSSVFQGLRVCSDLFPLSQWCHPTISSLVSPFSSCPQSFPASGSFPGSWLFASSIQSIGTLTSALVLPVNIQGWFLLGITGLIYLLFKGL